MSFGVVSLVLFSVSVFLCFCRWSHIFCQGCSWFPSDSSLVLWFFWGWGWGWGWSGGSCCWMGVFSNQIWPSLLIQPFLLQQGWRCRIGYRRCIVTEELAYFSVLVFFLQPQSEVPIGVIKYFPDFFSRCICVFFVALDGDCAVATVSSLLVFSCYSNIVFHS